MKIQGQLARILLAVLFVVTALGAARADDDPPGRVARLRYMSGQVSLQPGGVNDWVEGTINRPLTTSDRIWTDKESRAELSLGSSALRTNSETSLTFTNVSDNTVQLELDQGALNLTVFSLYPGEIYEVDTPNMAFTITKAGEYRFDVLPNSDETWVTVRRGEGEATGEGRSVRVRSNEQARFFQGNSLRHDVDRAPGPDGFDDWCRVRNQREANSISSRYVAPGTIGYEDLDEYGYWNSVPEYGPVWYPRTVAVGWAPYHYGHWVWIAPWGWTWVDDAPWGFAPFHYGRWAYVSGRWGWCPGPVVVGVRPVYAPALVAWVGGSGFSVGVGVGPAVGWFPLGFREPYYPAYRVSPVYVRNVNVTNTRIVNVTNVVNNYHAGHVTNVTYVNRNAPGGVTVVSRETIVNSRPVARNVVAVRGGDLNRVQVMGRPDVAPARTSVLGIHAGERSAVPPSRTVSRPVVSRMPAPQRPASFESRQPTFQRNAGAPVNTAPDAGMRGVQRGNPPANVPSAGAPGRGVAVREGNAPSVPARQVPRPPQRGSMSVVGPGAAAGANTGNAVRENPGAPNSPYSNRQVNRPSESLNVPRSSSAPRVVNRGSGNGDVGVGRRSSDQDDSMGGRQNYPSNGGRPQMGQTQSPSRGVQSGQQRRTVEVRRQPVESRQQREPRSSREDKSDRR